MLAADIDYQSDFPECFIRKYDGEYDLETNSVSSIWEIEIDTNHQRGDAIKTSNQV